MVRQRGKTQLLNCENFENIFLYNVGRSSEKSRLSTPPCIRKDTRMYLIRYILAARSRFNLDGLAGLIFL